MWSNGDSMKGVCIKGDLSSRDVTKWWVDEKVFSWNSNLMKRGFHWMVIWYKWWFDEKVICVQEVIWSSNDVISSRDSTLTSDLSTRSDLVKQWLHQMWVDEKGCFSSNVNRWKRAISSNRDLAKESCDLSSDLIKYESVKKGVFHQMWIDEKGCFRQIEIWSRNELISSR
jgi:hypothetical protein